MTPQNSISLRTSPIKLRLLDLTSFLLIKSSLFSNILRWNIFSNAEISIFICGKNKKRIYKVKCLTADTPSQPMAGYDTIRAKNDLPLNLSYVKLNIWFFFNFSPDRGCSEHI